MTKFTLELQKSRSEIQSFYNHTKSLTHEDYANDTEFSKEYWEIKRSKFIPKVTCSIVRERPPYNSYKGNNLLNKRSELINKCRHLNKHTLLRHDSKGLVAKFSCKS